MNYSSLRLLVLIAIHLLCSALEDVQKIEFEGKALDNNFPSSSSGVTLAESITSEKNDRTPIETEELSTRKIPRGPGVKKQKSKEGRKDEKVHWKDQVCESGHSSDLHPAEESVQDMGPYDSTENLRTHLYRSSDDHVSSSPSVLGEASATTSFSSRHEDFRGPDASLTDNRPHSHHMARNLVNSTGPRQFYEVASLQWYAFAGWVLRPVYWVWPYPHVGTRVWDRGNPAAFTGVPSAWPVNGVYSETRSHSSTFESRIINPSNYANGQTSATHSLNPSAPRFYPPNHNSSPIQEMSSHWQSSNNRGFESAGAHAPNNRADLENQSDSSQEHIHNTPPPNVSIKSDEVSIHSANSGGPASDETPSSKRPSKDNRDKNGIPTGIVAESKEASLNDLLLSTQKEPENPNQKTPLVDDSEAQKDSEFPGNASDSGFPSQTFQTGALTENQGRKWIEVAKMRIKTPSAVDHTRNSIDLSSQHITTIHSSSSENCRKVMRPDSSRPSSWKAKENQNETPKKSKDTKEIGNIRNSNWGNLLLNSNVKTQKSGFETKNKVSVAVTDKNLVDTQQMELGRRQDSAMDAYHSNVISKPNQKENPSEKDEPNIDVNPEKGRSSSNLEAADGAGQTKKKSLGLEMDEMVFGSRDMLLQGSSRPKRKTQPNHNQPAFKRTGKFPKQQKPNKEVRPDRTRSKVPFALMSLGAASVSKYSRKIASWLSTQARARSLSFSPSKLSFDLALKERFNAIWERVRSKPKYFQRKRNDATASSLSQNEVKVPVGEAKISKNVKQFDTSKYHASWEAKGLNIQFMEALWKTLKIQKEQKFLPVYVTQDVFKVLEKTRKVLLHSELEWFNSLRRISKKEFERRKEVIFFQVHQYRILVMWSRMKENFQEHRTFFQDVLRIEEMWPTFFGIEHRNKGKYLKLLREFLADKTAEVTLEVVLRSEYKLRLELLSYMLQRKSKTVWWDEEELKEARRQGISVASIIFLGDLLDFQDTNPTSRYSKSEALQILGNVYDFMNKWEADDHSIHSTSWSESYERAWLEKSPRLYPLYKRQMRKLVLSCEHIKLEVTSLNQDDLPLEVEITWWAFGDKTLWKDQGLPAPKMAEIGKELQIGNAEDLTSQKLKGIDWKKKLSILDETEKDKARAYFEERSLWNEEKSNLKRNG